MPDFLQVSSSSSWFSRLGKAFTGIVVGLVLIVIGIGLLFWNEGRAVKAFKTLKEGRGLVTDVASDAVDSANNGKLVHISAAAVTDETLVDEDFGVSASAIRLRRDVEMFQWKENKSSETRKKLGGGEETVTTYTYIKAWSNMLNDTANFQEPSGHENPSELPYSSMTLDAERVAAGAFHLSPDLISQLSDFKHLPVRDEPEGSQWPEGARADKGGIYLGANPAQPQVGDARIKFSVVEQGPVSVVAAQNGDTFADYQTKVGGAIDMIVPGNVPAQQMFEDAISNNVLLTWILRLVGFILIWIGFGLLFAPLSVLADIFPLFGSLVGAATGLIAFLLALAVALAVIAIAWVVFRPLLGVALLVVAVVSAVFGFRALRKKPHAA